MMASFMDSPLLNVKSWKGKGLIIPPPGAGHINLLNLLPSVAAGCCRRNLWSFIYFYEIFPDRDLLPPYPLNITQPDRGDVYTKSLFWAASWQPDQWAKYIINNIFEGEYKIFSISPHLGPDGGVGHQTHVEAHMGKDLWKDEWKLLGRHWYDSF